MMTPGGRVAGSAVSRKRSNGSVRNLKVFLLLFLQKKKTLLFSLCLAAGFALPEGAPCQPAPGYAPMADQPDPTSFVKRADTGLVELGAPIRFGGADIAWLGVRRDGDGLWRRTTAYEVKDALLTLRALGGTVVRSVTVTGTAGCDLCLEPTEGHFDAQAFAALDQTLKTANDLGMHLILPLTGSAGDCARVDQGPASICAFVRWHGGATSGAFFSDPAIRTAFIARVHEILSHVNALTGVAYRDDPSILAWENCDACGEGTDPAAVAAWSEAVGKEIKSTDRFHLYENGAFAGHIIPGSAHAVPASAFATESVDIVGDKNPPQGDEHTLRLALASGAGAVNAAGRVYALDGFDWGPRVWKTPDDLEVFLNSVYRERNVAFGLVSGLMGHADGGGFIQPMPGAAAAALYFPGIKTAELDGTEMTLRARKIRHFEYNMAEILLTPSFLLPPAPEIINVEHGKVTWRGAAGAASYAIQRSVNPDQFNSWETLCHPCGTPEDSVWQDPAPPGGNVWYRVMPFNVNDHKALPSAPVKNR
jgi:mannan endo-1,4-beta-mannosidase